MLGIIWAVLKVVGIVVAVIIGIIILCILLALLVPIRYRIKGEKGKENYLIGKFTWLYPVVYSRVEYVENELKYFVKIFGITLMDSEKVRKPKEKQKKKKKVKTKKSVENETKRSESAEREVRNDVQKSDENNVESKRTSGEVKEKQSLEITLNDNQETKKEDWFEQEEEYSFWQRIEQIFYSIWNIPYKLRCLWEQLKERVRTFFSTLKELWSKIQLVIDFLRCEENRPGYSVMFGSLRKIIKHLNPKVLRCNIRFGTGDPCTTGQILGIISWFYGKYADVVTIIPEFEEEIYEGDLYAKGRVRVGTLLWIALRLWFHKDFNTVITNFNRIKEEF